MVCVVLQGGCVELATNPPLLPWLSQIDTVTVLKGLRKGPLTHRPSPSATPRPAPSIHRQRVEALGRTTILRLLLTIYSMRLSTILWLLLHMQPGGADVDANVNVNTAVRVRNDRLLTDTAGRRVAIADSHLLQTTGRFWLYGATCACAATPSRHTHAHFPSPSQATTP